MKLESVSTALTTQFAAIGSGEKVYEAVPYTPVSGTAYLRETFMPAQPHTVEIGSTAPVRALGLYQIDVFAPGGSTGSYAGKQLADTVMEKFKAGTTLTSGTTQVLITKTYRLTGRTEADWYHIPVIVEWRADIAR